MQIPVVYLFIGLSFNYNALVAIKVLPQVSWNCSSKQPKRIYCDSEKGLYNILEMPKSHRKCQESCTVKLSHFQKKKSSLLSLAVATSDVFLQSCLVFCTPPLHAFLLSCLSFADNHFLPFSGNSDAGECNSEEDTAGQCQVRRVCPN